MYKCYRKCNWNFTKGGSIIGSSTNANVFCYPVEENGETVYKDLSENV